MVFSDINECSSNPCKNGGACKDLVNGFICTCVLGYGGVNCNTGIVIDVRKGRLLAKNIHTYSRRSGGKL